MASVWSFHKSLWSFQVWWKLNFNSKLQQTVQQSQLFVAWTFKTRSSSFWWCWNRAKLNGIIIMLMVGFDWGIRISIKIQLKLMCIWIIYKWFISLLITNFRWLNHPSVHEFQLIIIVDSVGLVMQFSNYTHI